MIRTKTKISLLYIFFSSTSSSLIEWLFDIVVSTWLDSLVGNKPKIINPKIDRKNPKRNPSVLSLFFSFEMYLPMCPNTTQEMINKKK